MDSKAEGGESPAQVKRSRRELLAGAAGALGVLAAEAIGKAAPARAADGDPFILGQSNSSSSETNLITSSVGYALGVLNPTPGAAGGVIGYNGVAPTEYGILSEPLTPAGVHGKSSGGSGVFGETDTGRGVLGKGNSGRGGVFSGDKAQLKLHPSSASTHPKRGQRGDLFVDKSGRLWFCKGKTTWVQLA